MSFFRSEFFACLLSTNFREGSERSATLPLSTPAAELFIRFLYGFELDELDIGGDGDIDTCKDLLAYGGMCGLTCLQDAVGAILWNRLSRDNVFDLLDFAKQNNAEAAVKTSIEYAVKFFSKRSLLEKGHLARHPDIAVRLCEQQVQAEKPISPRSPSPYRAPSPCRATNPHRATSPYCRRTYCKCHKRLRSPSRSRSGSPFYPKPLYP